MNIAQNYADLLAMFDERSHELEIFMDGVGKWFRTHPSLNKENFPIIHSVKYRLKNRNHLHSKIARKSKDDDPITSENLFSKITDMAGVRVIHLYQEQAKDIHKEIMMKVKDKGDWFLFEEPKAYTWDPESRVFFENMGLHVQIKESFYTSLHYVIKPRKDSPLCCEIQVRTLFEEIWGEVDHMLNYPSPINNVACQEQIRVLAKVVGAGSRLVDSIFRTSLS